MSIETDTLKTLERIEELLDRSLTSLKAPSRPKVSRNVGKGADTKDLEDFNKQVFIATKRLDALSSSADKTGKSLLQARGDVVTFRKGIRAAAGSTSAALDALSDAVARATLTLGDGSESNESTGRIVALGRVSEVAAVELGKLYRAASLLNSAFGSLIGVLKKGVIPTQVAQQKSTENVTEANRRQSESTKRNADSQKKTTGFVNGFLEKFGIDLDETGDRAQDFGHRLSRLGSQLADALVQVIEDMYALQARGVSAGGSLFELYGNAIKAGMSLSEYTAMLEQNSASLVRFGNFGEFKASLRDTTESLKALGVFGPSANQLAASMRTNSVALGVPISQVDNVAKAQIETFKELRKSTLMTAEGFTQLLDTVSNNQNVQEDLLGLAPAERAARQQQLLQIGSLGHKLGLTQQASASLTEALLAQRKATAEQRFKAAGLIRQAGAMVGMGAGETEELAKLRMKKRRSPEEEARFVELSGRLEQGLQAMQNSGNIQAEFLSEKMGDLLGGTPQGEVQQAAGKALMQQQSGAVKNADVGKETPVIMQKVGEALTTLSGFMKNPLGEAMVTLGTMAVQIGLQVGFLKAINDNIKKMIGVLKGRGGSGAADDIDVTPGGKGTKGKKKGIFGRAAGKLGGMIGAVGSLVPGLGPSSIDLSLDAADTFGGVGEGSGARVAAEKPPSKLAGKVGGFAKGALKSAMKAAGPLAIVGMLWDAFDELFSGNLGAAFGESASLSIDMDKPGWLLDVGSFVLDKIDDMVMAVFRGAVTIFTDLGDAVLHAVGFDTKEMFGGTLTNLFDTLLTNFIGVWKTIKLNAMKMFNIGGIFDGSIQEAEAELDETAKTQAKLSASKDATLTSIGEANNEAIAKQKAAAEKAKADAKAAIAATKQTTVFGVDALESSAQGVIRSVQTAQAGPQIATPGPTKTPEVKSGEVNKNKDTAETKKIDEEVKVKTASESQSGKDEVVAVLNQQLMVLQNMLSYWTNQEDLSESLIKAASRPSLKSNVDNFNAVVGTPYA